MSAAVFSEPHAPAVRPPCRHTPQCPDADAIDATAARVVDARADEGRYLLCNGVVVWKDGRIERPAAGRR